MESKRFVFLVLAILAGLLQLTEAASVTNMQQHVGKTAELPCYVDTKQCGKLHSLKWYRDTSRIYVFSQVGGVKSGEGDATDRMELEYETSSPKALLRISPVEIEDEADYKCEITYWEVREGCETVHIIKLKTLVVPDAVRILDENGRSITNGSYLDPADEDTEIALRCEAHGGRPTPTVSWYKGKEKLKGNYEPQDTGDGVGTGVSRLFVTLTRADLLAEYTCLVESDALVHPIESRIYPNVRVRPTSIELTGSEEHSEQGEEVTLTCIVRGARPGANVTWQNTSEPLQIPSDTKFEDAGDGTITTISKLRFTVTRYDNSKEFRCLAENEVIINNYETSLKAVRNLDVYFPPVVTVRPSNVTTTENGSVLLYCEYVGNPQQLEMVVWQRDGKDLSLDEERFEGGTIKHPSLRIKQITRNDIGSYTCTLQNSVGISTSEMSIYLDVIYPAEVKVLMSPEGPINEKDCSNVTMQCKVEVGNPEELEQVKWYLDGLLLHEINCSQMAYEQELDQCSAPGKCNIDASLIRLDSVQRIFAGNYSCQGKNAAGWGPRSDEEKLEVYYPPRSTKILRKPLEVKKLDKLTLECVVDEKDPGYPEKVSYLWYQDGTLNSKQNSSTWVIDHAGLSHRANFTCIAYNEGGNSTPSTVSIDVKAPPVFINMRKKYFKVLASSKNVSLTCHIECYPRCSIKWLRNGRFLETKRDPRYYYVNETELPANTSTGDFESIKSILVFNVEAWPRSELEKSENSTTYTCLTEGNRYGGKMSVDLEVDVQFAPENATVTPSFLQVKEHEKPEKVNCSGKGRPQVSYYWTREGTYENVTDGRYLELGPMLRDHSGVYTCTVYNEHGKDTANITIDVLYPPKCDVQETAIDGRPSLVCLAKANPENVTFTWRLREDNYTEDIKAKFEDDSSLSSYLVLENSVHVDRTYICYVNNSVGESDPCEIDVPGNVPWWQSLDRDTMIIIIASMIGLIVCVIIICIIIILLCRRKRTHKYTNQVELEERENPEGQSPDTSGQSKWPLKPGIFLHVNRMHNLNQLSPLSLTGKPLKQPKSSGFQKYKRNKGKVYARLERLKDLLGLRDHGRPIGITESAGGVVTFKKFKNPNETSSPKLQVTTVNSRKRKKPGLAPNQSSAENKNNVGLAQPDNGSANPNNIEPENKGFYENLPFHGMQNPPNKLTPLFNPFLPQQTNFSLSANPTRPNMQKPAFNFAAVKRHQSFHGFQNQQPLSLPRQNLSQSLIQPPLGCFSYWPRQASNFAPVTNSMLQRSQTRGPLILQNRSLFTHSRAKSFGNVNPNRPFNLGTCNFNPFLPPNAFNAAPAARVVGRKESQMALRTVVPKVEDSKSSQNDDKQKQNKPKATSEKRFGSLEIKKHRCYSPTYYSLRCRKHAKKRPIIYAIPKKSKTHTKPTDENKTNTSTNTFQNLTDSIQILEQDAQNTSNEVESAPKPTPRCSKLKRCNTVYQNVSSPKIKESSAEINKTLESSNDSSENCSHEISTTEAVVHKPNESQTSNESAFAATPKGSSKDSPTVMVRPSFIKPKVESPKGVLSLKIQAKLKPFPSPTISPPKSESQSREGDSLTSVPEMPILDVQNKWSSNKSNPKQNAFYTLTTPHYRHLTPVLNQQYSATIPHPKHTKLAPRSLFQDQQLAKSKSFSSRTKQKKHVQMPLQKCHSFRFQTAESYFQPIKNANEEDLLRNGYVSGYPSGRHSRQHKREKQKGKGPLFLVKPGGLQLQEGCVQLQYPQPLLPSQCRPNGVVYADLDMSPPSSKQSVHDSSSGCSNRNQNSRLKTEYATLKFNDVGQEIDV